MGSQFMGKEVYDVHKYDRIPVTMENVHLEEEESRGREMTKPANIFTESTSSVHTEYSEDYKSVKPKAIPRNCWLCEGWSQ